MIKDQIDKLKDRIRELDLTEADLQKLDITRKYDDDFMEDADGISWRDHMLLYSIAILFGIFIVWAGLARVDEVSRGDGKVIPSSQVQVVQNLEGGIIDEFLVNEGDTVEEGQVILRIRNTQAKADYSANNQKYLGLLATTIRLQAEAEGRDSLEFPDDVRQGAPDSVKAEQDAFNASRRQREGQIGVLQQQKNQKEQEVAELQRRISDIASVMQLAQDQRSMVAPMVDKGAAAKMELLQVDREIAQQRAELNSLKLSLPRSQAAVEETIQRLNELQNGLKADAQRQLADKTIELNALKETLGALLDRSDRTEITSPVRGKVQAIKVRTLGGVLKPGEPIMEIVPLEDLLIVEARIKPSDIAFIHTGQSAIVRLSAYDFSVYGALHGEVKEISADTITNDKGESFYRVRIQTDKTSLEKNGSQYDIIPGMVATVDIVTGRKSILSYLLKPFIKASQTAMRER